MEDVTETVLRVHYRRQISPKQYEVAEFAMDVEHTFPAGMSPEEIMKSAERMATEVKVAVFTQLGLDYTQDEETRVVLEAFPNSQKVASIGRHFSETPNEGVTKTEAIREPATEPAEPRPGPRGRETAAKPPAARRRAPAAPSGGNAAAGPAPELQEMWEDVANHPENWFYNAPEDKPNPRGPDFKATNKSGWKSPDGRFPAGLWLNTKPEDLVLPDDGYANG